MVTQCAAVNTHWVPIRAPPHRYWFRELIKATCQHHSAASASSPPTTLDVRVLDVPLTPHTYLLYVDGGFDDAAGLDVVSVDTVGFAEKSTARKTAKLIKRIVSTYHCARAVYEMYSAFKCKYFHYCNKLCFLFFY